LSFQEKGLFFPATALKRTRPTANAPMVDSKFHSFPKNRQIFIGQGRKTGYLGGTKFVYDANNYLVLRGCLKSPGSYEASA
jgi:hypothetical protein